LSRESSRNCRDTYWRTTSSDGSRTVCQVSVRGYNIISEMNVLTRDYVEQDLVW
jgi:hypothetical protein